MNLYRFGPKISKDITEYYIIDKTSKYDFENEGTCSREEEIFGKKETLTFNIKRINVLPSGNFRTTMITNLTNEMKEELIRQGYTIINNGRI